MHIIIFLFGIVMLCKYSVFKFIAIQAINFWKDESSLTCGRLWSFNLHQNVKLITFTRTELTCFLFMSNHDKLLHLRILHWALLFKNCKFCFRVVNRSFSGIWPFYCLIYTRWRFGTWIWIRSCLCSEHKIKERICYYNFSVSLIRTLETIHSGPSISPRGTSIDLYIQFTN